MNKAVWQVGFSFLTARLKTRHSRLFHVPNLRCSLCSHSQTASYNREDAHHSRLFHGPHLQCLIRSHTRVTNMIDIITELQSVLKTIAKILPAAFSAAPPPSDPPRLRVGWGGDIPVSPLLAMAGVSLGGFAMPHVTGISGGVLQRLLPNTMYHIPARLLPSSAVAFLGARTKKECRVALEKAGTGAGFQPVSTIADTGPYAKGRNPMYWALLAVPAMMGLAADNAWVSVGANLVLWLYLHLVVVPAEEKFLQEQLGDDFKKYCATVKRWGFF